MSKRFHDAARQWSCFAEDLAQMINRRWWRIASVPLSPCFSAIAAYRIERSMFLLIGRPWTAIRIMLAPLSFLLRPWSGNCEIHYEAEIGAGFRVLHPSLGAVVSKYAVIGRDCVLVGGNCVGGKAGGLKRGDICIGDGVTLGANATVLGPVRIGDGVMVAAGAVVVGDVEPLDTVAGAPARSLGRRFTEQRKTVS